MHIHTYICIYTQTYIDMCVCVILLGNHSCLLFTVLLYGDNNKLCAFDMAVVCCLLYVYAQTYICVCVLFC